MEFSVSIPYSAYTLFGSRGKRTSPKIGWKPGSTAAFPLLWACYLILPDELPTYDIICGAIVNMLLTWYVRLAQSKDSKRLARRLNVILDEFANIAPAVPNLPHLLSAGRSRGIRCHICLQSLAQLNDIYGPAKAAAIRDNVSLIVVFRGNNWETLSELSRMCGEREVERSGHFIREPLITPL